MRRVTILALMAASLAVALGPLQAHAAQVIEPAGRGYRNIAPAELNAMLECVAREYGTQYGTLPSMSSC